MISRLIAYLTSRPEEDQAVRSLAALSEREAVRDLYPTVGRKVIAFPVDRTRRPPEDDAG